MAFRGLPVQRVVYLDPCTRCEVVSNQAVYHEQVGSRAREMVILYVSTIEISGSSSLA